jgi:hypothetical protein
MKKNAPITYARVRRSLTQGYALPAQRATSAQLDYIAQLIIDTGSRWDCSQLHAYRVWEASDLIQTLRNTLAAGGEAAQIAAQRELDRMETLEEYGKFCFIKGGHPRDPNYGGPESYR